MTLSFRSWSILWLLVLAGVALAVFGAGLHIGYYSDDFSYYIRPLPSDPFYFFYNQNPGVVFYRPLQSAFVLAVQSLWGLETLAIHLVTLLCHVVLSWLVAVTVVRLGYTRLQAQIGSSYILLAQVGTYAVLSNDTLSQVGGVLFGCLAPWLLYFPGRNGGSAQADREKRPAILYYLLALISLAISLSLKETSTAYLAIVGIALLVVNLERLPRRQALLRTALQLIPFILLVGLYMVVRSQFVTGSVQFGDSRYDLNLGLNIPKNIALFLVASSTAHSSVDAFVALQQKDVPMLVAIAIPVMLFAGLVCRGLWLVRRDRPVAILLLLYFFGFFPAILFNRVSEHYIYNSFPFLAALVGIAAGGIYQRTKAVRGRVALGVAMGLLLVIHVVSIQSKMALMQANGERAADLLEQLRPIVQSAPPNSMVSLVNPPNPAIEYSIYIMTDFDLLEAGFPGIQTWLGRPDLKMDIREHSDSSLTRGGNDSLMLLTLDNGRVIPFRDSIAITTPVDP